MPYIGQNLNDVSENDLRGGFSVIPDGEYRFVVTASDYRKNKNGTGHNLELSVQCMDPAHRTAKWREWLSLDNPSVDATRIARAKLKQLAIAVGLRDPNRVEDSSELHMKPFIAVVKAEPANNPKYGDVNGLQNRIVAFKPIVGGKTQADAQNIAEEDAAVDAITGGAGEDDLPF